MQQIHANCDLPEPVLVTGASGFIGGHLCRRLISEGRRVIGVTRRADSLLPDGVDRRILDLSAGAAVERLFETDSPQTVFHLAGHVVGRRDVEEVLVAFRCNLTSTVNLLLAARKHSHGRFILTGSLEEPQSPDVAPSSPYAASKAAATAYARMFHALYGLSVVVARVFMVYGPEQKDRNKLIPFVTDHLLAGDSPRIGSGVRAVDWIHVSDVVGGLMALATTPGIDGRTLDIGTGRLATVGDVVEHLAEIIVSEGAPVFDSLDDRPMEQVRKADVETTRAATGWFHKLSLEDGLEDTVRWHRQDLENRKDTDNSSSTVR
jgi:nucleoside-diphosphate-sugar epimerase